MPIAIVLAVLLASDALVTALVPSALMPPHGTPIYRPSVVRWAMSHHEPAWRGRTIWVRGVLRAACPTICNFTYPPGVTAYALTDTPATRPTNFAADYNSYVDGLPLDILPTQRTGFEQVLQHIPIVGTLLPASVPDISNPSIRLFHVQLRVMQPCQVEPFYTASGRRYWPAVCEIGHLL